MRWIDMHCDTVSEIYKNRKGTLMKNTLCVDMERLERVGAQMQFFACFVNLKDYRTDLRYADEKKTKNPVSIYKMQMEQVKIRKVKTEHIRRFAG